MANEKMQHTTTGEKIDDVRTKAEELTKEAAETIKEETKKNVESSKKALNSVSGSAENMVKDKPFVSIGCAFVAGVVLAKLLK
ncbi:MULTISPECIES: hypothetical protein [Vibrio]|uniref:DUF883 domain-containing protein n=2 Tax=Vibrio TaxID=662 RepID=A0A7X4LHK2_9VIBR|nr:MULTISPECIES: hypothetical protein [Vibrio]MBF9003298.1 hypothetical protein [Vibrio nitrifigilis]MZI92021.1 hypothetical protein [Vibrio eleionomae]